MFKLVVIVFLLVIFGSLGSALWFLLHDKNRSPRTIKALTTRIGLSLALFGLLFLALAAGWIKPHGLGQGMAGFQGQGVEKVGDPAGHTQ